MALWGGTQRRRLRVYGMLKVTTVIGLSDQAELVPLMAAEMMVVLEETVKGWV